MNIRLVCVLSLIFIIPAVAGNCLGRGYKNNQASSSRRSSSSLQPDTTTPLLQHSINNEEAENNYDIVNVFSRDGYTPPVQLLQPQQHVDSKNSADNNALNTISENLPHNVIAQEDSVLVPNIRNISMLMFVENADSLDNQSSYSSGTSLSGTSISSSNRQGNLPQWIEKKERLFVRGIKGNITQKEIEALHKKQKQQNKKKTIPRQCDIKELCQLAQERELSIILGNASKREKIKVTIRQNISEEELKQLLDSEVSKHKKNKYL